MRKRILTIIALIVFTICIFPVFAFGGTGVVRLNYVKPGVSFKIYKIGDFNGSGVFAVDEDFSAYGIDFESSEAAQTLAAYVERDNIAEERQALTGSDNTVIFSGLESGYYLILGETYNDGDYIYTALPVMLTVYEGEVIEISGKYEMADISDNSSDYQSVSALKVWSGGSLDSIVVQLLCDGEVYDEQTLNSSNNWRYTWNGLDLVHSWTVTEKEVPSGYSLSIEKDGQVFILLNTKDSDTPGGGGNTAETSTEVTTDAKTETTTKKPSGSGGGGSVYPNETETTTTEESVESTTEESAETTTESGYEQGTEEEEVEETTEKKNDSSDDDKDDDDEDNSGSDDSPEPVTDEYGKVISESQVGDDSGTGTDSSALNSSASVSSESGEASAASVSSNSESGASVSSVSSGSSEKLPQTGQLWYPVPILSCCGILLLILGIGRRRMSE
ncbi:MAG: Cna B-type domain-containing protein [Clostridiales bacterium]|nr:Cna B-type domain-containing protein [Clostridiales bacterium]